MDTHLERECLACHEVWPRECFYLDPRGAGGLRAHCKWCLAVARREPGKLAKQRQARREWYEKNREKTIANTRRWAAANHERRREIEKAYVLRHPERLRARTRKYREANPEENRARGMVNDHIRNGNLSRKPCEVCGDAGRTVAHHDDYSKPLDIMWLCAKHHTARHVAIVAGVAFLRLDDVT